MSSGPAGQVLGVQRDAKRPPLVPAASQLVWITKGVASRSGSVVPEPAASASLGEMLEMQIFACRSPPDLLNQDLEVEGPQFLLSQGSR